jgi:AcrR family transcriptional regulator
MTLGNLQHYFTTRDDLFEAVVLAEFEEDVGELDVIGSLEQADAKEKLAAITRFLVDRWTSARSREGSVKIFATLTLVSDEYRARDLRRRMYERLYAQLTPHLREMHPRATKLMLARKACLITAVIDGVVRIPHEIHQNWRLGNRAFVDEVVDTVVQLAEH